VFSNSKCIGKEALVHINEVSIFTDLLPVSVSLEINLPTDMSMIHIGSTQDLCKPGRDVTVIMQ